MQKIEEQILNRCKELLENGTVEQVIGWEKGIFDYDVSPAIVKKASDLSRFVYNKHCGGNLSKYLVKEGKVSVARNGDVEQKGKTLVLLKPCDTYSLNELLLEHRVKRENVYIIGVPCGGMEDEQGLLLKCKTCKGNEYKVFDEVIESDLQVPEAEERFALFEELENMSAEERFEFWREELSKCIRCNACRNVCPACTCIKCIFDNNDSGVAAKANDDTFEENMFHIIRAFHVAGRCTDCGECSRVCPQGIPLHLLNRKFIKDINEFYGEYQAGDTADSCPPLVSFTKEDCEPSVVHERGRE